jgi:hypothetical protein
MSDDGPAGDRPWRLRPRTRKSVLVVHIASAGAWLGIDVVLAVVIVTAIRGDDATRALCYQALELFAGWPLVAAGLVCLASGVVLGLGTPFGLVRYWWVVVKLVINVVFVALVPIALRPEVLGKAEQGRHFMAGLPATLTVGNLIYPPIVSPAGLIIAMILAVFKPWGLIRKVRLPTRAAR